MSTPTRSKWLWKYWQDSIFHPNGAAPSPMNQGWKMIDLKLKTKPAATISSTQQLAICMDKKCYYGLGDGNLHIDKCHCKDSDICAVICRSCKCANATDPADRGCTVMCSCILASCACRRATGEVSMAIVISDDLEVNHQSPPTSDSHHEISSSLRYSNPYLSASNKKRYRNSLESDNLDIVESSTILQYSAADVSNIPRYITRSSVSKRKDDHALSQKKPRWKCIQLASDAESCLEHLFFPSKMRNQSEDSLVYVKIFFKYLGVTFLYRFSYLDRVSSS